jgi:chloride channel protein, CIC family
MSLEREDREGSLLVLALLACVVGAGAGAIGALFRFALTRADGWRDAMIAWSHGTPIGGFVLVIATCAAAVAIAAWLVRRFSPEASGSGIPHAEAVLREEVPPAPFRMLPVKFFGGLLAIGAGLALGREGPSVQMGASIAHMVGRLAPRRTKNPAQHLTKEQQRACLDSAAAELVHEITYGRSLS